MTKTSPSKNGYIDSDFDFDAIPAGLYRTKVSDGSFLKANLFLANMLGFESPQELINSGIKSADLYDPTRRQELIRRLKQYGDVSDFEIELKTPNGPSVWVNATARLHTDRGYIEGSLNDITPRKEMEKELMEYRQSDQLVLKAIQEQIKNRLERQSA